MSDICLDYTHLDNSMCEPQGTLDVSSSPSRNNNYLTFFDLPDESINITECMDWNDIKVNEIFIGSNLKLHDYEINAASKVRDKLLKSLYCKAECCETIVQGINKVLTDVAKRFSSECIDAEFTGLSLKSRVGWDTSFNPWWHKDMAVSKLYSDIRDPQYPKRLGITMPYNKVYRLSITFQGPATSFCINDGSYCKNLEGNFFKKRLGHNEDGVIFTDEYIVTPKPNQGAIFDAYCTYHAAPKSTKETKRTVLLSSIYCLRPNTQNYGFCK